VGGSYFMGTGSGVGVPPVMRQRMSKTSLYEKIEIRSATSATPSTMR